MNDDSSTASQPEGHATNIPPIIGIGASAGGVDALRRMFPAVARDCGMAFVVVLHLDPDRESALTAILARSSALPVTVIADGTVVEPNHVYVIPPNASLSIEHGHLRIASPAVPQAKNGVIDAFFASLAGDQGENAACVILSGTGSDGTLGLRAIKEFGGLALAQSDATYDGMMRSAVATGLVDAVLPAEEIAAKIADYFSCATELRGEDWVANEAAEQLASVTTLLRNRTGHDFSGYKDKTIVRRVQRRMQVLQITDVSRFVERLRADPHEVTLLFQDLLIGVTEFFRDREAFAALQQAVIPELFRDKGSDQTIRVWVPGCSTGEEAYSIAILLRDHAATLTSPPKLQIFASDIDERALTTARVGRYPVSSVKDVSADHLAKYFVREDGTYRISTDIREICLFSAHNLLRDAPFSRQDLISCRNLLIYLGSDLQGQVIPLFHYALKQNGYLFLGTSENVTRHSRLFATVDKNHRIFQRRGHLDRRLPDFPLTAPDLSHRAPVMTTPHGTGQSSLKAVAERALLERYLPAYAVINAEGDLLQSSGRTGKYLELPPGSPDTNIFSMARTGLRLELRAALHRAIAGGQAVLQPKVVIGTNGGRQEIDLYVQPLRAGGSPDALFMVVFQDVGAVQSDAQFSLQAPDDDVEGFSVRQLETELRSTRERLQATTEELESSNEELKSSNEELSSMNEELQSSNEELETSKEELQSINEELHTVNAELNTRVEDLTRANNDMSNLLDSTQIATIFLDRALLVKGFTPAAKDVFHLVESDAGRPIMHVRPRFTADNLREDAERVLRTLATIEKPVRSTENDTLYMMRLLPYRTADNVISGVVLTFIDVTRVAEAEAQVKELTRDLQARVQELETVIGLIPVGIMIAEGTDGSILVNQHGARLLGYLDQHKGLIPTTARVQMLDGTNEIPDDEQPLRRALATGSAIPAMERRLKAAGGAVVDILVSATPLFGEKNKVRGAIAAIVDVSEHKLAEARQRMLLDELQHRVKNTLATVTSLAARMGRRARSVQEFQEAFLPRLAAMGRMHDLLAGAWEGAGLRALVTTALDPQMNLERSNIVLNGPDVMLTPDTATTLGMVFHELATNAAKYGALSVEGGTVEVSWGIGSPGTGQTEDRAQIAEQNERMHITWLERNGPPVKPPATEGFGAGFVRRSIAYEMEGSVNLAFLPEGLRCDIDFPLIGNVE
jgi:two-component system CheB/CheR fusion protein